MTPPTYSILKDLAMASPALPPTLHYMAIAFLWLVPVALQLPYHCTQFVKFQLFLLDRLS